jgi:hypothetical protein
MVTKATGFSPESPDELSCFVTACRRAGMNVMTLLDKEFMPFKNSPEFRFSTHIVQIPIKTKRISIIKTVP